MMWRLFIQSIPLWPDVFKHKLMHAEAVGTGIKVAGTRNIEN